MFSAADLIEAVQRKLRVSQRRSHPPGEFPPGWKRWFDTMQVERGAVGGASSAAFIDELSAREPHKRPPGRLVDLNRWQAFAAVWRQEWTTEAPRERGLRWAAGLGSFFINLFLGTFFLWLLLAQPRVAAPAAEGEETVVQVEYIGDGSQEDVGGGPEASSDAVAPAPAQAEPARPLARQPALQPQPQPQPEASPVEPAPEVSAPALAPVAVAAETPRLEAAPAPLVERAVPTPPVEQNVTVSEPAPDTAEAFFLPPPTPSIPVPASVEPELDAAPAEVATRDIPAPKEAPTRPDFTAQLPETKADIELEARATAPRAREVQAPVRRPDLVRPSESVPAPARLEAALPSAVRERAIPAPATSPASSPPAGATPAQASARTEAPGTAASASPGPDASTTSANPAGTSPATTAGAGPRPEPAPGSWPTPARSDDFGASERNVPGGQRGSDTPGLYNRDGSLRMPGTPGSASPAQPPGEYTEEIADLDRNGTWLKRPPIGYEPTLFDRYWRPNETLLQEWVRRGIKTVEIPIPGTGKKISCAVSLLALGGGCGISDPNLNEQPADARPPPDIPFKPELQEGNGSLQPALPEDGAG